MIVAGSILSFADKRVKKEFRLTRQSDFKRVRRHGKSYAHPLIVLTVAVSEKTATRFGLTAGKWVGGAVDRNHAKRLLREALRLLQPDICPGFDVMIIARKTILNSNLPEIASTLSALLKRAKVIKEDNVKHSIPSR